MSLGASDVCVAHLVRRANDIAAFRVFLDSYRRCPAGAPHELLIIFKGFDEGDTAQYEALLEGLPHKKMFVDDRGFDIGPYIKATHAFQHKYFAFFNSFSLILQGGWLDLMLRHGARPGIGIVGATGSYQSQITDLADLKRRHLRLNLVFYKYWHVSLHREKQYWLHAIGRYKPFPNYHVRSNSFFVPREVLARFRSSSIRTKWDAWRFESGAKGLTSMILQDGMQALVVGRDGNAYALPEWHAASTFWIRNQENLLVSDNQTRAYTKGHDGMREHLAFHAWRRWPDGRLRDDLPTYTP